MQATKAFLLVVLFAGATACQREEAPEEVKPAGKLHEFTPDVFHNAFAATTVPVLRVASGDSIHTTTIDAAGTDENGCTARGCRESADRPVLYRGGRAWRHGCDTHQSAATEQKVGDQYGYPVEPCDHTGAWCPHERSRATRSLALGSPRWHRDAREPASQVSRSMPCHWHRCSAASVWRRQTRIRPHTLENSGCGAVTWTSTESWKGPPCSCPSVFREGFLYIGDAHAAQGDGELSNNGLETSMDVTLRVERLSRHSISAPRVESSTHLMALGLGASLDDALRKATTNMVEWLMARHGLTFPEVSQVLGTSAGTP